MKRATVLLSTSAIAAMGIAVGLTPASGAKAVDNVHAIKFGVPRIVDPIHTYGEPDIKVAPNGTVYVSGGRRGLDLGLAPADLVRVTGAVVAAIGR